MRILTESERFRLSCDYAWMQGWKEEITGWFEDNEQLFERSDRNPYVFYILEDMEQNYSTAWLTMGGFDLDKKIVGIISLFSHSGEIIATLDSSKPELIEFYKETLGERLRATRLWENGRYKNE